MNKFVQFFPFLALGLVTSCVDDHDDPELAPINTSDVKITASVDVQPSNTWFNQTEELTIKVSDVEMKAPKGVVLRDIVLLKDGYRIIEKPFSGETLEYKIPLRNMTGRVNFSLRGSLIQKGCRDAEIIIADNIQRIVFTDVPEFECEGYVVVTVRSRSTTGEEYHKTFEVKSTDHFTIPVSQSELYWTPASGTASTLEVTLAGDAKSWSTNSTLASSPSRIYWGSDYDAKKVISLTIPNTPGALAAKKLQLYVMTTRYGTYEGVTVEKSNMTYVFGLKESE